MPERTGYEPGVPCWVDLMTTDVDASSAFYGGLFGWEREAAGPPDETGGYGFFLKNGQMVAGVGPTMNEQQPPVWGTYVCTDDAAATAEKVKSAGGQVMAEPFAVMDVGHMGVFADPTGAVFSVWQPGRHQGAQLVNEAGALSWNELQTRDPDAAKRFYADVFGWQADTHEMGPGFEYTEWKHNGGTVGGMMAMGESIPAEIPPHWLVYFGTDDADAAVAKITELGGSIAVPPTTIPAGRFAVATDSQGSAFAVFQGAPQS